MSNNVYQQFIDAQKAVFATWRKTVEPMFARSGEVPFADPAAFFEKMQEAPNDFWKKAGESYKAYQAVFELWKQLSEKEGGLDSKAAMELYDAWSKQYFDCIKNNLTPALPGFVKDFSEKLLENMETNQTVWSEQAKTWAANAQSLHKAALDAMVNGPKGYLEFLEAWQKGYEESYGKLMNAPTFGKDMEFWKQQKAGFDRFIKYNVAATKFYAGMYDIAQDATKKVLEDYIAMRAEGTEPKTFEEFYKYWSKAVSSAYQTFLFSDEMSRLAGNMVDEMSRFKIAYDELCETWLENFPVVRHSDINDVYKTLYELKKEVRALKKEIRSNEKRA